MSQALFRRWIREASEGIVSPAQITAITDRFMKLVAREKAGESVYVPKAKDGHAERAANMRRLLAEGKSLRQVAEMFDCSHECVRTTVNKPNNAC